MLHRQKKKIQIIRLNVLYAKSSTVYDKQAMLVPREFA